MNQQTANKLIDKTRDDYNLIAEHFASTRFYVWKDIAKETENFDLKDKKVLDLGCGNGRLCEFLTKKGAIYTGLDLSPKLISIAKKSYPNATFRVGSLLRTPFKDNEFDYIYCIATLHHIPSKKLRLNAIAEINRILKPGGQLFFTNWYFWNKPKFLKQIYKSFFQNNGLSFGDFMMSWKKPDTTITTNRYFHAWTKTEMWFALRKYNFKDIKLGGYIHKIWFLLAPNLVTVATKPK